MSSTTSRVPRSGSFFLGQWLEGRTDRGLLRRDQVPGLDHQATGAPHSRHSLRDSSFGQGVHARAGVNCADCHMPQTSHKGTTLSDHWVRSRCLIQEPLPRLPQEARREDHRERAKGARRADPGSPLESARACDDRSDGLIADLKRPKEAGGSDADLATARYLQRRAQFYLDSSKLKLERISRATGSCPYPR